MTVVGIRLRPYGVTMFQLLSHHPTWFDIFAFVIGVGDNCCLHTWAIWNFRRHYQAQIVIQQAILLVK